MPSAMQRALAKGLGSAPTNAASTRTGKYSSRYRILRETLDGNIRAEIIQIRNRATGTAFPGSLVQGDGQVTQGDLFMKTPTTMAVLIAVFSLAGCKAG